MMTKKNETTSGYEPVVSSDMQGMCDQLVAQGASGEDILTALIDVASGKPDRPSLLLSGRRPDRLDYLTRTRCVS